MKKYLLFLVFFVGCISDSPNSANKEFSLPASYTGVWGEYHFSQNDFYSTDSVNVTVTRADSVLQFTYTLKSYPNNPVSFKGKWDGTYFSYHFGTNNGENMYATFDKNTITMFFKAINIPEASQPMHYMLKANLQ